MFLVIDNLSKKESVDKIMKSNLLNQVEEQVFLNVLRAQKEIFSQVRK